MHLKIHSNFANDNGRLSESDRDAVCIAFSLDDARSLQAALRERIEAIRQRSRMTRNATLPLQHERSPRRVAALVLARNAASI